MFTLVIFLYRLVDYVTLFHYQLLCNIARNVMGKKFEKDILLVPSFSTGCNLWHRTFWA